MSQDFSTLNILTETIRARANAPVDASYTASLLQAPVKKAAQKVAEEGVEVALAAVSEDKQAITYEMADLLFHLLVLCEKTGVELSDILDELKRREGTSGHEEKATRKE